MPPPASGLVLPWGGLGVPTCYTTSWRVQGRGGGCCNAMHRLFIPLSLHGMRRPPIPSLPRGVPAVPLLHPVLRGAHPQPQGSPAPPAGGAAPRHVYSPPPPARPGSTFLFLQNKAMETCPWPARCLCPCPLNAPEPLARVWLHVTAGWRVPCHGPALPVAGVSMPQPGSRPRCCLRGLVRPQAGAALKPGWLGGLPAMPPVPSRRHLWHEEWGQRQQHPLVAAGRSQALGPHGFVAGGGVLCAPNRRQNRKGEMEQLLRAEPHRLDTLPGHSPARAGSSLCTRRVCLVCAHEQGAAPRAQPCAPLVYAHACRPWCQNADPPGHPPPQMCIVACLMHTHVRRALPYNLGTAR